MTRHVSYVKLPGKICEGGGPNYLILRDPKQKNKNSVLVAGEYFPLYRFDCIFRRRRRCAGNVPQHIHLVLDNTLQHPPIGRMENKTSA